MPYLYLLHYDDPLSAAQHYAGVATGLRHRLTEHANGHGSKLTKALHEKGIEWRLCRLAEVTAAKMRQVERSIKDSANLPQFCPLCRGGEVRPIPLTRDYPLSMIPFEATSRALRSTVQTVHQAGPIVIRPAANEEAAEWIVQATKPDKDALGFEPTDGYRRAIRGGRLWCLDVADEPAAYCVYTVDGAGTRVVINQLWTAEKHRLHGYGRLLLRAVRLSRPDAAFKATVRQDLPACLFWQAEGFQLHRSYPHATSGNVLNEYLAHPIIKEVTSYASV